MTYAWFYVMRNAGIARIMHMSYRSKTYTWKDVIFLLALPAILHPLTQTSFDLGPSSIATCSDMALQCHSVEQVRDISGRVCEPCRGNGITEHLAAVCHLFCGKLGVNAITKHGKLQQAFGDDSVSRARAFRWHNMLSDGKTVVEDEQHSGRPSTTRTGDNTARVRDLFEPIEDMIADEVNMNRETALWIMAKELGMRKLCAKMVPRATEGYAVECLC